jgi:hypothetical protein
LFARMGRPIELMDAFYDHGLEKQQ